MMNGFIVIDKPSGLTSHDVVNMIRRTTGQKKVGHTGTLDPFATGVLPVALGEATKAIPFLDEVRKEYRAVMKLGETTDTQDCTGNVIDRNDWRDITTDSLRKVINRFNGRLRQLPPMFSALKHNGVPLYKLARRGDEVARKTRDIEVFSLVVDMVELPEVAFTVSCTRGTYVRTLAHDIGSELGCGAHLTQLQRLASGNFHLSEALSPETFDQLVRDGVRDDFIIPPYEALAHFPDLIVDENCKDMVSHGIAPKITDFASLKEIISLGDYLRISFDKRLIAVAQAVEDGNHLLRLVRVFN